MNILMTICNSHILPRADKKHNLKNTGRNFERLIYKRLVINNIVKNNNDRLSDYPGG